MAQVLYVAVNGMVSMALMAVLAELTRSPFVFPSLGPTAFMLFHDPAAVSCRPAHVMGGHGIGIACGYLALVLTGLQDAPSVLAEGVNPARVVAVALSLGLTGGLMIACKVEHPPAGATTMIVSLGLMAQPWQLVVIALGVALLLAQAMVVNRWVWPGKAH